MTKYILTNTAFGEGLDADTIESIARSAILHDVGKIAISDVILNKPGKLTKEEFEIMKQHTVKGAELLDQICRTQLHDSYLYAREIARHHHERWDGNGYPDGLAGDEISLAAQVVSIVDVYDALISVRVYKKAFSPDEAVEMIRNGQCGVFNPKLIACFLEAEPIIREWYASENPSEMMAVLTEDVDRINAMYAHTPNASAARDGMNAAMDVLLTTAVQNAYDMIISVNLTKNIYSMMGYDRFKTHCADSDGEYEAFVENTCGSIPVSNRTEFYNTFRRKSLIRAYRAGNKSVHLEYPQYSDGGELHQLSTRVLFMEDDSNGDILMILLTRYIDEAVEQREKTRKILTDALSLAEQANHARYDFLSKMSHDIRTPLNAIIGMTTIIASHLDNQDVINDCLCKIGMSSKSLLGFVNDVLDYTKIETGSLVMHLSDFNLYDLIAGLAANAAAKAESKRQTFHVHVSESVLRSYIGDELRIRQVLSNLLDNAHRYTASGGEYTLLVDAMHRSGEYDILSFTVSDTGKGIKASFIDKLFEPFAQGESASSVESMGLGLPIARNLAHLMNGDIGVVSEAGKGSSFTFELPLARSKEASGPESAVSRPTKPQTDPQDIRFDGERVLIVEDNEFNAEVAQAILETKNLRVDLAPNGRIGCETFAAAPPGTYLAIFMDILMPVMNGIETTRAIRATVGPDVSIIVISAYAPEDIRDAALAAGANGFINKPLFRSFAYQSISEILGLGTAQEGETPGRRKAVHGMHLLIAEDNDLNWEIARELLAMYKITAARAENGQICLDMLDAAKDGEYDAVLMDIQMPVMNGYDASAAIRSHRRASVRSLPVVAMTADAYTEDVVRCLEAGMNAHVPKPIDMEKLLDILSNLQQRK